VTFAFGSLLERVERDGGGAAAVPGRLRGAAPQWLTAPDRLPNERPPTPPGERLLEAFVKPLGVSQSALASRLGVPRQRLGQLLRGQSTVAPDTALRLARDVGRCLAGTAASLGPVARHAQRESRRERSVAAAVGRPLTCCEPVSRGAAECGSHEGAGAVRAGAEVAAGGRGVSGELEPMRNSLPG